MDKTATANADYDRKPFLEMFGYLWYARREAKAGASVDEILKLAIRTFQERFRLKVSGELDDETVAKMETPRCDNPDFYRDDEWLYWEEPQDFYSKKNLESFGFMGLARAQLCKYRDLDSVAKEEILELAVNKFQQTYGLKDTGGKFCWKIEYTNLPGVQKFEDYNEQKTKN